MIDETAFTQTPEALRRIVTIASKHLRPLNAELSRAFSDQSDAAFAVALCSAGDRPEIWEIMTIGIGPVGYVAGWGFADGMDAVFGWDGD
jgi:hypothetical protein